MEILLLEIYFFFFFLEVDFAGAFLEEFLAGAFLVDVAAPFLEGIFRVCPGCSLSDVAPLAFISSWVEMPC